MGTLKKILTTGVGAALMTESSLRNALSDSRLTQQAKEYLTRQAVKGKDELVNVLSAEVKKFLARIRLDEELRQALSGMTIEVEAKIRLSDGKKKHSKKLSLKTRI